jgi:hypothetical protein
MQMLFFGEVKTSEFKRILKYLIFEDHLGDFSGSLSYLLTKTWVDLDAEGKDILIEGLLTVLISSVGSLLFAKPSKVSRKITTFKPDLLKLFRMQFIAKMFFV